MLNNWVISHYQHFWHYLHWKLAPHCRNGKLQPHRTAGNENRNCTAPQWFIQMTTATASHRSINQPQLHRTAAYSHAVHRTAPQMRCCSGNRKIHRKIPHRTELCCTPSSSNHCRFCGVFMLYVNIIRQQIQGHTRVAARF